MTEVTIDMPPALQSWIETRIAEGLYADANEYLRDLVRRDQDAAGARWLQAIPAGERTGPCK